MTDSNYYFVAASNKEIVAALLARAESYRVLAAETAERYKGVPHYNGHIEMAKSWTEFAAVLEASPVDVAAIYAMDKQAIRAVPEADLDFARKVTQYFCMCSVTEKAPSSGHVFTEGTRRKAAATKAARAVEQAAREGAMTDFLPGQTVGVHAFGHWYTGKVIRTTRTGSVVVEYTSGTGTTRQKTVGNDKIRA